MKFYLSQINSILDKIERKEIKAILLYGPDKGYISKVCKLIIQKFDLSINSIDYQNINASLLEIMLNSRNFFSKREFIKVGSVTASIDQKVKNILKTDFLNFIVFIADELPPASSIRKLFETESYLASIGCYHDDAEKIEKIILRKCSKHGKIIGKDALNFLKNKLKGDHQTICNELNKLILFVSDKDDITLDIVIKVISNDMSASGDDLCVFFVQKNLSKFLEEIEKFIENNVNEVLIIRALLRYYLNLYIVLSKTEAGINLDSAIKSLYPPIFFKYINDFKKNALNLNIKDIIKALSILQEAEITFKLKPTSFDFYNDVYLKVH